MVLQNVVVKQILYLNITLKNDLSNCIVQKMHVCILRCFLHRDDDTITFSLRHKGQKLDVVYSTEVIDSVKNVSGL